MSLSKNKKKLFLGIFLSVIVSGAFSQLEKVPVAGPFIQNFEQVVYDWCFTVKFIIDESMSFEDANTFKVDRTIEPRIVLVDIDEASLDKLGDYRKWPRTHHADVVRNLSHGGAASITFDILFKKADYGAFKSQRTLNILKKYYPDQDWEQYEEGILAGYDEDSKIETAVKGANVIAGMTFGPREEYEHKTQWWPLSLPERRLQYAPNSSILANDESKYFLQYDILDNIFLGLAQSAKRIASVNVLADNDGVHRREPLLHKFPNPEHHPESKPYIYPSIALQTALFLMGKSLSDVRITQNEFIDMGKPFYIRRKNGKLETSYPGLTIEMIFELLSKKEPFKKLNNEKQSQARVLIAATQVVLYNSDDGNVVADIFYGQTMSTKMIQAIIDNPSLKLPKQNIPEMSLTDNITLSWDEDEEMAMLTEDDEEVYIDKYTLEIIQKLKEIPKLKQPLHLAMNLSITWDQSKKTYSSNIILLNDAVLKELMSLSINDILRIKENQTLAFGKNIKIPIDKQGRMRINYLGNVSVLAKNQSFKKYSYADVQANRIDPATYQNQIFILGSTAAALEDIVSAPAQKDFPGVYIHMNMLENILKNNFLTMVSPDILLIILLLIGFLGTLTAIYLRPILTIFLFTILGMSWFVFHYENFTEGLYYGVVLPELGLVMSFSVALVFRYLFEEKERKQAVAAFKSYISPELIDQMLDSDEKPSLGGQEKDITAYFTDIANFSTFSEKIGSPSKLVELLNEYLTAMTDILLQETGTLDKYEGDAIIAFFGAPVPLDNHAKQACLAAIEMQRKLQELRIKWASEGDKWPVIVHHMRMRIGINSGPIVTGNMGSALRMNYTMMGDAVNLAARLESGAKQYGVFTMCSKETLIQTDGHFLARAIDRVKVVGKSEPVESFEILEELNVADDSLKTLVELWQQAQEAYFATDWDLAETLFKKCLDLEPFRPDKELGCRTTPSNVFLDRISNYKTNPPVEPGLEWDGVYTAREK
jgi:adenylate cyclase